jgi:hypothetical protein
MSRIMASRRKASAVQETFDILGPQQRQARQAPAQAGVFLSLADLKAAVNRSIARFSPSLFHSRCTRPVGGNANAL